MQEETITRSSVEQWRSVPGWTARYQVSSLGRVRGPRGIRRTFENHGGYRRVPLYRPGEAEHRYVHRLVLLAFVGACPVGQCCRHLNGDPGDNRLINLAWGTRADNEADKRRHGRHRAKLTEADIVEIRQRYATGEPRASIAGAYGIAENTVRVIGCGKIWAWVGGPRTDGDARRARRW